MTLVQLSVLYYKQLAGGDCVIRNAIIPEDSSVSLARVCEDHLKRNIPSGLSLMAQAVTRYIFILSASWAHSSELIKHLK